MPIVAEIAIAQAREVLNCTRENQFVNVSDLTFSQDAEQHQAGEELMNDSMVSRDSIV